MGVWQPHHGAWHDHHAISLQPNCMMFCGAAGNGNGAGPVQSPGTPSRSFTGNETLGAGLENLRAASNRSASTTPEDPEVGPPLP